MTKDKAIILEIDGVLSNDRHRRHLIDCIKEPTHFDEPSKKAIEDEVNEWCSIILKCVASENWADGCQKNNLHIIFITERPKRHLSQTIKFIDDIGLSLDWEYMNLFMRPDFLPLWGPHSDRPDDPIVDNRPSHQVKREIYEREIKDKYDMLFVLERAGEDADMYRKLGLTVLEVK